MKSTGMISLRKRIDGRFVKEPLHERFWRNVEKTSSCWLWKGTMHRKGYGEFMRCKGDKTKAHRMAWELTHGEIPNGTLICHKCDVRQCVNPDHLFLGNDLINKHDSMNKGRHAFGEKCGRSKLNADKVMQIRALDKTGLIRLKIASMFGISGRQVTSVCRRDSWKHIP